jgi:hypothetical protein
MLQWSFSGLKKYRNCPKQYYEVKVAKNYADVTHASAIFGKEVHSAIQSYVEQGAPFPKNYAALLSNVPRIIELLPGRKIVEHEMAIDAEYQPCSFDNANYFARGIADLVSFDGNHAFVIDWKTGSYRYADPKQLTLMALLLFYNFPEVMFIDGMLFFTKTSHPVFSPTYERKDIDTMWAAFTKDLNSLRGSFNTGNWPMTPSGLCGFCPVEVCPHWRV